MVFRHVLLAASFFGTAGNELGQQILASSTLKFAFFGKFHGEIHINGCISHGLQPGKFEFWTYGEMFHNPCHKVNETSTRKHHIIEITQKKTGNQTFTSGVSTTCASFGHV